MRHKKLLSIMLVCTMLLAGCSTSEPSKKNQNSDSNTSVENESSEVNNTSSEESTDSQDVVLESDSLLSVFDNSENQDYIISTSINNDSILKSVVKLSHNVDFKVDGDLTTMTDHIIFDDSNYGLDVDENGDEYIMPYEDLLSKHNLEFNDDNLSKVKSPSDNVYYDIIVVDGYSSVCSDSDISEHYNTNGGVHEKSKNGESYTAKFKIKNYDITVDYKYGYDGNRYCVDVVATYPNDYDGLRILGLGQDRSSCSGFYATTGVESMDSYISKKDLSKIFKVWGTDGDNDMMELSTYADFIFNKDNLSFDISYLVNNQYFFGGALALGFDSDTFIHNKDDSTYTIPVELTWYNMINTSTITVFNPLLENK